MKNIILNFHDINDPKWFEDLIQLLKKIYTMIDVRHLETWTEKKERPFCHITFDDGDLSFYTQAYPILKKHKVPATLFVSPHATVSGANFWFQEISGYDQARLNKLIADEVKVSLDSISKFSSGYLLKCLPLERINSVISAYQLQTGTPPKRSYNMTIEQVLEVEQSGLITIGSHTQSHPILRNESDIDSEHEITSSIKDLQALFNHEIKYFAFPNGTVNLDYGDRELNCLERNNIKLAFTTRTSHLLATSKPLEMPRFGLSQSNMYMVRLQLFLGARWGIVKFILGYSETAKRRRIKKKLKHYSCSSFH